MGARTELESPILDLPLRGEWIVLNPPGHAPYAFDFLAVRGARIRLFAPGLWGYLLGAARAEGSYSWRQPVYAPFVGIVSSAVDGLPDRRALNPLVDLVRSFLVAPVRARRNPLVMAGNHLVISNGPVSVLLAHLRQGSLRVEPGQRVLAGQLLAEIGNSGNTVAPHLHCQVMNGPNPLLATIIPYRVRQYERWNGRAWERVRDGALRPGDHIRACGA